MWSIWTLTARGPDPNGPMYYMGWYHLFYQYNPKGAVWGNIVWAHSVSRDLVNWIPLEPAIAPSIPSDKYGCWSGSATILPDGTPAIMYTGIDQHKHQVQNVAFPKNLSDPFLREWVKPGYNPVISPGHGVNASAFRDPTTAWFGPDGQWRLLVGSRVDNEGLDVLYQSRDFKTWVKAKHPLHSGLFTGMWECPDFFPRTDQYVPDDPNGDQHRLRYDYGNFYASKTFYDPAKRRRILWGWANESDSVPDDWAKGWAGIQAVPRKIWLDPSGKQLLQWPIEEIEKLRGKPVTVSAKVVNPGEHFEITGLGAYQADVEVTFKVSSLAKAELFDPVYTNDAEKLCGIEGADIKGGVGPFGLWVLASANLHERTAVFFRVFSDGSGKYKVLMCTDPTKYGNLIISAIFTSC
ncbi:hypothetical protein PR202_gb08679 [Eleusine coracana subsp. coracana]|uniref:Glycosyl hydrolase family 32 N-terminal domain-containing protein n=1 Tax=Eleusine coracana subsp. coracana TaxID=191504 RepID=A0AAV5EFT1_ELECO|nr:hypothetical protein PR202_gb08679 [Eleusine coracana subsp. coracana]